MSRGTYIRTDEIKKKNSNSNKGRPQSDATKLKISNAMSGENNPMYGHTHTEQSKKKIGTANKNNTYWLGRKHSEDSKKKQSIIKMGKISPLKNIKKTEEQRKKNSESHKGLQMGENNPNWQGGISFLPYCEKFNDQIKEKIRERDNRTCQLCGKLEKEEGRKLSVHHIHYDKENCYPDLISLCRSCNAKVNSNRIYHENLFMNKLNDRGLLYWTKINN